MIDIGSDVVDHAADEHVKNRAGGDFAQLSLKGSQRRSPSYGEWYVHGGGATFRPDGTGRFSAAPDRR